MTTLDGVSPRSLKLKAEGQMNNGKLIKRRWTENEVQRLKLLVSKKLHCEEISRLLDRTPSSITQKAFWLNLSLAPKPK
jgi:hypothetical protein